MKITPTALELLMSAEFWKNRYRDQLSYIHEIERSDRTAGRKAELQLSALEVYRDCLHRYRSITFFNRIISKVSDPYSFDVKAGIKIPMEHSFLNLPPVV